jgi:hypothetical protein
MASTLIRPHFRPDATAMNNPDLPAPSIAMDGPGRGHRGRLHRALAAAAGISQRDRFPPALRALSALGLPVRPLHFKSITSLFLSGLCLGLAIFGGSLWLFTDGPFDLPPRGPIAGLVGLGWPGVCLISIAIGAAFTLIIRAQAARARLPRWQDL